MVVTVRVQTNSDAFRRLQRRLDPAQRTSRVRAGMVESLAYLQGQIQAPMRVDSGRARASVLPRPVTGRLPGTMRGSVGSSEVHVLVMERGRRPGQRQPPIGPILLWMLRHGLGQDEERAWAISRKIGRFGIRGWPLFMFRNAARRGRPVIASIISRHMAAPS